MIVGLLAVLKTGAAYLPLDPDYPATASLLCYMMPSLYLCSPIVKAQVSSLAKTACRPSSWMIRRIRKHFGNMPSRTLRMPTGFVRCHRFTRPMSFTRRDQQVCRKVSSFRTAMLFGCLSRRGIGITLILMMYGRCFTPTLSISLSGKYGAAASRRTSRRRAA